MEDVIEELVGEIEDEFDARTAGDFITDGENVRVAGTFPLHALRDRLKMAETLDDVDESEVDTISGYITERLGRWPRTGDTVTIGPYIAKVLSTQQKQAKQVMLTPAPKPTVNAMAGSAVSTTPSSSGTKSNDS
jgi:magnesium and cobalt transporter